VLEGHAISEERVSAILTAQGVPLLAHKMHEVRMYVAYSIEEHSWIGLQFSVQVGGS
jgi:hypothetical protein